MTEKGKDFGSVTTKFLKARQQSVGYALHGLVHVIKTQQNAWIHLGVTILVVLVALVVGLSRLEWALLLIMIALVWMAEFMNTALEVIVDLASPEKHPLAKIGKDVGAGAVLITALVAILVGLMILGPGVLSKLGF